MDETLYRLTGNYLNKWESHIWGGLSIFNGNDVWTDGTNIYYSHGTRQYKLNKDTNTWEPVTWNGLTDFNGSNIWTDAAYTEDTDSFNGFTIIRYTWTEESSIYYGDSLNQYRLNKDTDTWEPVTLTEYSVSDNNVWTDGTNIYYSNGARQYRLTQQPIYEEVVLSTSMKVKDRGGIWYPVKGVSVRTHGGSGPAAVKLDTKVPCLTANGDVVIMYDADGNILAHKSDIGNAAAITRFAMYEIRNIYTGETCPFNTSDVNAEQVSSIYIDGEGYLAYNDADDTEGENPRQMLEWNSLNEAMIDFASIAGYPRYS